MSKKKRKRNKGKKARTPPMADQLDRHILYEEAVQAIDFDLDFFERIYRAYRGRAFRLLREDFCGTAAQATSWAARHPRNRAWGIDIHQPTLDWGRRHHLARLDAAAQKRVTLVCDDVMSAKTPPTDITVAFNFSYWIYKTRESLVRYFKKVHKDLAPKGMLMLDAFGGQEATGEKKDRRKIPKSVRPDGQKIPKYTYIWDQVRYNAIDHDLKCHIHFRFSDGSRIDKAFSYDWRMWTLPELQELLKEAGFQEVHVYLHGWYDDGESDDVYRRRTYYKNELSWVGYLVALK